MTKPELWARYRAKHGKLVEPTQGFHSLDSSLHLAYSIGRVRGFTDLGTYVDKPGDHGIGPPAFAFDLGRKDRFLFKGWDYLKARRLAKLYWAEHRALDIEYVILGHKIISREKPYWHYYGPDESHQFHIHVSGVYP
jgi:hypothetical protein